MAGVGTTLVEAMFLGMDAVGVEYEQKFVVQANKNIKHIKKLFPDKKLGRTVCIKGDARNLSCLDATPNHTYIVASFDRFKPTLNILSKHVNHIAEKVFLLKFSKLGGI